jgi:hypothetical protein
LIYYSVAFNNGGWSGFAVAPADGNISYNPGQGAMLIRAYVSSPGLNNSATVISGVFKAAAGVQIGRPGGSAGGGGGGSGSGTGGNYTGQGNGTATGPSGEQTWGMGSSGLTDAQLD